MIFIFLVLFVLNKNISSNLPKLVLKSNLKFYHVRTCVKFISFLTFALGRRPIGDEPLIGNNNIDSNGAKSPAKALKVKSSITNIDLSDKKICFDGETALKKALKINYFITNINYDSIPLC
jgi:hypothetical protein